VSKFDFQQSVKWRFIAVLSLFFLIVVLIISRLFYISVIQNKYYKELAENQQSLNKVLPSKRGKIFFQDRFGNKKIAAFSADVYSIAVSPKLIKNPQDTASALSALFKKSQDFYISKLSKSDDPYEIIEKDSSIIIYSNKLANNKKALELVYKNFFNKQDKAIIGIFDLNDKTEILIYYKNYNSEYNIKKLTEELKEFEFNIDKNFIELKINKTEKERINVIILNNLEAAKVEQIA